ncbi:hypothetical protein [Methylobacterium haplocladii]|uniref:Uncharacterized protein n=1 Tax=Methylobacterium haplocladii TaxID=1176176 RepID=A0A512IJK3_9HYPH|nr:hypothetical protein [Methylobacterium haplocladii]GEO97818.1 hypothetical protein MHA02_02060 [Methylobacterium haplocladii]GJD82664.1 hypothetical protein HPGCJGGD_0523 [Methylobacterium haplocladii]GLS57549.1 hypothetical protein GCM10007887_02040 [Methylobacterium haplocladii]
MNMIVAEPAQKAAAIPANAAALRCRMIEETDRDAVVALLCKGFSGRSEAHWRRGLERHIARGVPDGVPRYGYLLERDGAVVGVLLTLYTRIEDGAGSHLRCNLSSWYVEPAVRAAATLLDGRAMRDKSVTYLNISPTVHTRAMHRARGFRAYADGQLLAAPALSRIRRGQRVETLADANLALLPPREQAIARDHAGYGCLVLVCREGNAAQAVVLQPHRIKALPRWSASPTLPCYQLVYGPAGETLGRWLGALGRHLLFRHGIPLLFLDANGPMPGVVGRYIHDRAPRYAKGPHPVPVGDLSYTEQVLFGE